MTEPVVRRHPTPNPNAMKLVVPGRELVPDGRPRSYASAAEAQADSLGSALFELDGVVNVFMVEDFVTVTKAPAASWDALLPEAEAAIRRVLGTGPGGT